MTQWSHIVAMEEKPRIEDRGGAIDANVPDTDCRMHVQSFAPDIRLPYNFDDYFSLRDPLLERARELARTI